jgi:hypothetical protein
MWPPAELTGASVIKRRVPARILARPAHLQFASNARPSNMVEQINSSSLGAGGKIHFKSKLGIMNHH